MVHTYTHSLSLGLAYIEESDKTLTETFQFVGILSIGIVYLLECTRCIDIVARIDAHFIGIPRCRVSNRCIEVHIGNKRDIAATSLELLLYAAHVHRFAVTLSSKAHKFSAFPDNAQHLLHTAVGIHSAGIRHGLNPHRIAITYCYTANLNLDTLASGVVEEIYFSLSCTHTAVL